MKNVTQTAGQVQLKKTEIPQTRAKYKKKLFVVCLRLANIPFVDTIHRKGII